MTRDPDPDPSRPVRDLPAPLTFGVFPLGVAGAPYGTASGAPDDYEAIGRALEDLRGGGPPLLPRMYVGWSGPQSTSAVCDQVQQLTRSGVAWDLALCYRDRAGDIEAWEAFVARIVREHGVRLAAIQVTGEANLTGVPAAADGDFPRAPEALVRGVLAGAQAKRQSAATAAIGFTVAPEVDPAASGFWAQVSKLGAGALAGALDYAGIDMYPDVFGPRFSCSSSGARWSGCCAPTASARCRSPGSTARSRSASARAAGLRAPDALRNARHRCSRRSSAPSRTCAPSS
ncbi:MAG: hypothetical protein M3Y17_10135, partial [Actinomycetota bacterium]|nr:hypothetical protein [Actinomycetota bacterium]